MGGDHKCPVCQATFTRPQHVARHMRSHTGDRPYKCQYCGDQFARSDLLSRHVNKCHANEKPLPNIGARRKGSASASRATSSKQACDQCVQSSLPCDGCNPCSKCVQRKCRCTYVKFHRQTAPAGPGHNPRPTAPAVPSVSNAAPAASVSSRVPMYQQPEDDFILGPAPTAVPTMAEALYNSNSFAFPPLYPSNDISGDNADYSNKYRTQAELFGPGRSGLSTGLTPNLYDPRPSSSWLGWDQQETNDNYQQHQRHPDLIPSQNNAPPSSSSSTMNDKNMQQQPNSSHYMNVSVPYPVTASGYLLPSSNNNSGDHDRRGSVDFNDSDGSTASHSMPSSAASSSVHLPLDNMSGQQRQQQSHGIYNHAFNLGGIPDRAGSASTTSSSSSHQRSYSDQVHYNPHGERQGAFQPSYRRQSPMTEGRPEFSSAFGLMSLDDPNVIAGIANDGTPFFSNQGHHQTQDPATGLDIAIDVQQQQQNMMNPEMGEANMDTPMPMKRGSGQLQLPSLEGGVNGGQKFNMLMGGMPTPGRDADTRELRDFWKQYMRTPLSGPGPSPLDLSASPANGSNNNKTSPTSYRRPRVASLPSAKTPIVERDSMYSHMAGAVAHHHLNRHDDGHSKLGPTSSMRTTLHGNAEDLRSYEAAVLARKAPTRLNLQVRRPAKTTLRGGRSESGSASAGNSPHVSSVGVKYVTSRPGSAVDPSSTGVTISNSSSASSLANAFGGAAQNPAQRQARNDFPPSAPAGRVTFAAKEESVSPSLSSRASSADIDDNGASSEMEALRPSFKRLPSQTLGPANSKRAYYGMGDESENDRVVGWGSNDTQNQPQPQSNGAPREVVGLRGLSHPDRVVASIAERRRRMSAPSSSMAPLELGLAGAPNHGPGGSGGVDVQGLGYAPAAQGGLAG